MRTAIKAIAWEAGSFVAIVAAAAAFVALGHQAVRRSGAGAERAGRP